MPANTLTKGISFIGAGNLAWSLIPACQAAGYEVEGIYSRDVEKAEAYSKAYNLTNSGTISSAISSGIIFLTVADQAISEVAASLSLAQDQLICHCSGSVAMDALEAHPLKGVLYPMQAFTDKRVVNFQESRVPIFVEGSDEAVLEELAGMAGRLSTQVTVLNSDQRKKLHLGAVLACNFPNLLFRYAAEQAEGVGLEAYESLIRHQVNQALALGPEMAQTGPAIRGDLETIRAHLDLLHDTPDLRELYARLSRLINPELPDLSE